MRVNHNIAAQVANSNLKRADNRVAASTQRLSSGYKINKAADDSAGLTISNKMRAQIRALDQASRNADDGVSVLRTADGALAEIENMLQRCRELSVQAANDTLVIADRETIQKEVDQLMDEIDRIAETTDFNGKKIFSGECSRVVTCKQSGVEVLGVSESVKAGTYKITLKKVAKKAGETPEEAELTYTAGVKGSVEINGTVIEFSKEDTENSIYEKVLSVCDMMDIDVEKGSGTLKLKTRAAGSDQQITYRGMGETAVQTKKGKDAEIEQPGKPGSDDGFSGGEAVYYHGGTVTITDRNGFEMSFALEDNAAEDTEFELNVYDTGTMKLQIGTKESEDLSVDFSKLSCKTLKLREADGDPFVNLCSNFGASNAISLFDHAIQEISGYRSKLGAYENRLDSTISALDINSESTTSAMSRIMDTDMAEEMTEYTQQNVLSQAAASILAQANNRPQQVMSLLQS